MGSRPEKSLPRSSARILPLLPYTSHRRSASCKHTHTATNVSHLLPTPEQAVDSAGCDSGATCTAVKLKSSIPGAAASSFSSDSESLSLRSLRETTPVQCQLRRLTCTAAAAAVPATAVPSGIPPAKHTQHLTGLLLLLRGAVFRGSVIVGCSACCRGARLADCLVCRLACIRSFLNTCLDTVQESWTLYRRVLPSRTCHHGGYPGGCHVASPSYRPSYRPSYAHHDAPHHAGPPCRGLYGCPDAPVGTPQSDMWDTGVRSEEKGTSRPGETSFGGAREGSRGGSRGGSRAGGGPGGAAFFCQAAAWL